MGGELPPVVVLAAGRSSRAGQSKGLVVVGGRAWIEAQLESLAACGVRDAVVVLGHDCDVYARALAWVAAARADVCGVRVTVARNHDPDRGPFSSLQVGLRALDATRGAFVLPVDVPAAGSGVWSALAVASGSAAVPVHEGRGGHPVLCGAGVVADVLATPCDAPDARLDAKLRARGDVVRVEVDDPRVTMNLNTPEDWARFASISR